MNTDVLPADLRPSAQSAVSSRTPLASKPALHATGGDGVSGPPSQTPHPSPLAGASAPQVEHPLRRRALASGTAGPSSHYSCRCDVIRRAAPTPDTCPACGLPLTLQYANDRLIDPNLRVRVIGDIIADTLKRLRDVIDANRPHLTLADVGRALQSIDEERQQVKLHDLGDTPLVMRCDYDQRPALRQSAPSAVSNPEGTY